MSKDGSELYCAIKETPDGVRVIKSRAITSEYSDIFIPASVEVMESGNLGYMMVTFAQESKLKSFDYNDLCLKDLNINNENYIKIDNGVVI